MEWGGPSKVGLTTCTLPAHPHRNKLGSMGADLDLGAGAVRCSDSAIFEKVGASATGYVY